VDEAVAEMDAALFVATAGEVVGSSPTNAVEVAEEAFLVDEVAPSRCTSKAFSILDLIIPN
jgi:hypothetical protein